MNKKRILWALMSVLLIASLALSACQQTTPEPTEPPMEEEEETMEPTPEEEMGAEIDCMGAEEGDTVSMLYQWSGGEEEDIMEILQPVVEACGLELQPESTRDQALLDTRVQAGTPPDIAFWNVTQLEQYQDILVPLEDLGVHGDNYADFWKSIGTVGGTWLGLPVKADPKTLVWYSPVNFEAFGYEVPETWDELNALVEQMVDDGNTPWSMGFESGDATGWTGTDFVQDILLVQQGPEYVNGILDGSVPYNDQGVKDAWQTYGEWAMSDEYTVGGAQGTLSTGFNEAILKVFSDPPEAMMVKQSGFAGGTITEQHPDFEYGTDYDFFGVPGAQGLQGGSDWMMMFSDKPAVQAIVAYLSSDAGGEKWAEVGFDLTPNSAGAGAYTDEALQNKADILTNASGFVPDIGDTIPGGFGSAEFSAISDFVNGAELDPLLDELADIQQEALGEGDMEEEAMEPFKAGMVTDVGGVDDKSFNAASWEGLQRAEENMEGFESQVLESQQQTDYATNINQLLDQETDLIVTVGFLLGEDTQTFAADNPETLFAIVDFAYEEPSDNLKGITFSTDEAAFLAGYVAAGMTETGTVGMFGGIEIPTVTIFMDGFAAGVNYYNEVNGTDVNAIGRNLFVGNFESTEDGRNTGQTLIDEGADIILPVAGPVGLGTAAVAQENEGVKVIWVDTDGCVSAAEYCDVFLTSVMKNMSNAVLDVATKAYNGETEDWSTPYDGTLDNGGVGIAPFHEYEDQVPDELKTAVDDLKQMIIDGELDITEYYPEQ